METPTPSELPEKEMTHSWKQGYYRYHRRGKVMGGFFLIGIGILLLARRMGAEIPYWVFSWKMLLIAIGLFIGVRHSFRGPGWMILVTIGTVFLLNDLMPGDPILPFIVPAFIIMAGLLMIFRPARMRSRRHWERWEHRTQASSEDYLDSVSVFGGVKKKILSKDFKGGEITCIFGGAEIDLTQADINGRIELEATNIFGGTKLLVPAHWQVNPEMTAILGGIEDKRPMEKNSDPNKVLILKGTAIFGGLEIKSF